MTETELEPDGKIIDFYERVPREYLNEIFVSWGLPEK